MNQRVANSLQIVRPYYFDEKVCIKYKNKNHEIKSNKQTNQNNKFKKL